MAHAKQGDTVKVHYTGKLDDGTVFDSSVEGDPLEFTLGSGQIIPGFDEAVNGMAVGEKKVVQIPSEKAYGPHREDMTAEVPRGELPPEIEPAVGMQLQANQQDGRTMVVTVTQVKDENVTLDANHPLAGKDLTFDIELLEVA